MLKLWDQLKLSSCLLSVCGNEVTWQTNWPPPSWSHMIARLLVDGNRYTFPLSEQPLHCDRVMWLWSSAWKHAWATVHNHLSFVYVKTLQKLDNENKSLMSLLHECMKSISFDLKWCLKVTTSVHWKAVLKDEENCSVVLGFLTPAFYEKCPEGTAVVL